MRDNRARRKAGAVLVDGWREIAAAIAAGLELRQLAVDLAIGARLETEPGDPALADVRRVLAADPAGHRTIWLTETLLEKVSYGGSHRGALAEFARPARSLPQIPQAENSLILVLDRIEKPGNVGAIFRCADAAGIDAVLTCDSADIFNPNSIRNSLGSVFHVASAAGSETELREFLAARGVRILTARVEGSTPLWSTDLRGPRAIVLGSEAEGLGTRWQPEPGGSAGSGEEMASVCIPMRGRGDSLNVAVSAALICYEAVRQRRGAAAN